MTLEQSFHFLEDQDKFSSCQKVLCDWNSQVAEIFLPSRKCSACNEKHSFRVCSRSSWNVIRCMLSWMSHNFSTESLHGTWLLSHLKNHQALTGHTQSSYSKQPHFHCQQSCHTMSLTSVTFFK